MKYTITSVIPVAQYANVQPSIEVEADSFEQAQAMVAPHMHKLWEQYSPGTLKISSGKVKRLKAFVGGEIDYDDEAHAYTWNGKTYLSGSVYAQQFERPFDAVKISEAMASKWGVEAQEIRDMWELKSSISMGLGTAIHAALELYGKYNGLADKLEKTTHLHDHPIVKKAVENFYKDHKEEAVCEALIVDHKAERAGRVDRLVILGDKKCRVEDFKTNAEMKPDKLKTYWKQLEFYGEIMEAAGWQVEPPVIHHWNGEWKEYYAPV